MKKHVSPITDVPASPELVTCVRALIIARNNMQKWVENNPEIAKDSFGGDAPEIMSCQLNNLIHTISDTLCYEMVTNMEADMSNSETL